MQKNNLIIDFEKILLNRDKNIIIDKFKDNMDLIADSINLEEVKTCYNKIMLSGYRLIKVG
jgi:hypothetical protein